jgi:transposase-like protein
MYPQPQTREERGLNIFELGQVKRLGEDSYLVASQSGNGTYHVSRIEAKWVCECPDHKMRGVSCKHIYATIFSTTLREKASSQNFAPEMEGDVRVTSKCLVCGSSHILKWGFRYRGNGTRVQRYKCANCRHRWDVNPNSAFIAMRTNPKAIMVALDLYFKGISLRKIQDHLKQFEGTHVSYVSVYKWIQKYVALMEQYAKVLRPQLSNVWHADEMKVNVHGEWQWLWNIMDSHKIHSGLACCARTRNDRSSRGIPNCQGEQQPRRRANIPNQRRSRLLSVSRKQSVPKHGTYCEGRPSRRSEQ